MPEISIVMPVYNGEAFVQKAIESLQTQTFSDIEILVVDDCSTDGTYELIKTLAREDSRIILLQTPKNLRAGGARNVAFGVAKGKWLTLLDADDWYTNDRLEKLLGIAKEHSVDIVIDNLQIYDHAQGKIVHNTMFGKPKSIEFITADNFFSKDNPIRRHGAIGYSNPLIRREFIEKNNISYCEKYHICEDFVLLTELILQGAKTCIIPEAYYIYIHQVSPSTGKKSPTSCSDSNALFIAKICDDLIEKYEAKLSVKARRDLLRRKQIFLTAYIADKQKELIAQKQYLKAVFLFLTHPHLIGYRTHGIANKSVTLFLRFFN